MLNGILVAVALWLVRAPVGNLALLYDSAFVLHGLGLIGSVGLAVLPIFLTPVIAVIGVLIATRGIVFAPSKVDDFRDLAGQRAERVNNPLDILFGGFFLEGEEDGVAQQGVGIARRGGLSRIALRRRLGLSRRVVRRIAWRIAAGFGGRARRAGSGKDGAKCAHDQGQSSRAE